MVAQEPRPLVLSSITDPEGIDLALAWRYAPGDGAGRAAKDFDDSTWIPVRPALRRDEMPRDWSGTGWFRRHLILSRSFERRPITIGFRARGAGEVYLDGKLIAQSGAAGAVPDIRAFHSDSAVVTFDGLSHVLAVRYRHPAGPQVADSIGFQVTLADPSIVRPRSSPLSDIVHAMLVGVPLFLVFLHLALFAFDRRGRENLFYAIQMAAFAMLMLSDAQTSPVRMEPVRGFLDVASTGMPVLAVFFGLLTYYGVRLGRYPRPWKAFTVAAAAIFILSHVWPFVRLYGWMAYFVAMVVEIFRVERSGQALRRGPQGMFLATLAIAGFTIVLQMAINLGIVTAIGGMVDVYVFGMVASAAGMSLYLAATLGQSRIVEAENERRAEEFARARELQLSMLPKTLPAFPGLDLAAATLTATEVGGDYYDVRDAGGGALLLAFGDATGHGLSAGIILTAAKALFTSLNATSSPSSLLAECDRVLGAMQMRSHRMALMLTRITAREVRAASAAMPPLLIHRAASGEVEEAGVGGLPLGTRLSGKWPEAVAPIQPGDTILFASDGFAELLEPSGEQFGYPAVRNALAAAAGQPDAKSILDALLEAANAFRGTRALEDDLTLVVVRAS